MDNWLTSKLKAKFKLEAEDADGDNGSGRDGGKDKNESKGCDGGRVKDESRPGGEGGGREKIEGNKDKVMKKEMESGDENEAQLHRGITITASGFSIIRF